MTHALRWTVADLEVLPDDGKRYEIIDGELYVSKQPSWEHQFACTQLVAALTTWSNETGAGFAAVAPGVIFADDDAVAPDLVWVSRARLPSILGPDRHLHAAPELVVEVLSPGFSNERRDREMKLKIYSRYGVQEYWIVNCQLRHVQIYRRGDLLLQCVATCLEEDTLTSPLLPGFRLPVVTLLAVLPTD
jgi:Uma2 family endonuclease